MMPTIYIYSLLILIAIVALFLIVTFTLLSLPIYKMIVKDVSKVHTIFFDQLNSNYKVVTRAIVLLTMVTFISFLSHVIPAWDYELVIAGARGKVSNFAADTISYAFRHNFIEILWIGSFAVWRFMHHVVKNSQERLKDYGDEIFMKFKKK